MKQYYMIGWLFDKSTVTLLQEHTQELEQKFDSVNPLVICDPHITLKAPFELDNSREAELVAIISEQVKSAPSAPILSPGECKYFECAEGYGKHLVFTYNDLLDKHAGNALLFRQGLSKAVEDAFPETTELGSEELFYTTLGLISTNYGAALMVRPRSGSYSVPRIITVALFKRREDGSWRIVSEADYLKH